MKRNRIGLVGTFALLLAGALASAEVKVAVEHNDADHSTAEFKFKEVPAPAKTSAASSAKFSLADGEKDGAGGELDVLHDGKLPAEQDDPANNFFFNAGSEGGRLVIDLGKAIDIKQVNTYSWHTDTRAPQVYNLYAADGTAAGFNAAPSKDVDPATAGWKLVTKVDTRPKTGEPGGQYGVSISDTAGPLGKYRYLLLAVTRTEADDDFGNTFFSEITVIDNEMLGQPAKPGDKDGVKLVSIEEGKYTATIDTSETPDMTDWATMELTPMVVEWYPKLVEMLPGEGYSAPTHFSITFRANKQGVADTGGTRINCAASFFRNELNGQAKGAILHEMVHVVQQYGAFRAKHAQADHNPGWLVEGIPDYIRWYQFEPKSNGTAISKKRFDGAKYDGSYRITANFLNFTINKYDKDLVKQLNDAMREGRYSEDLWKQYTGKSVQGLNTEWKTELAKSLGISTQAVGT